jgi:1-acyl-sn-glycerol-3-phosphate acyltransferase
MANHVAAGRLQATAPSRFIRLLWGAAATALSFLYTAILAPVVAALAAMGFGRPVAALSRLWGWLIIRTCGVKVEIEGLEHLSRLKSYVLVANHQSFFDIFAIVACLPGHIRFVAKKELLKIPFVGYALVHDGHIIVDRQRGGKSIRHALAAARDNYPICVFAEGHRYNDGRVHEFSDGAAWLAVTASMPCVPAAISGSGAFFPRGAKLVVPGGTMTIRIMEPIPTAGLKSADRAALTRRLEETVRSAFET